MRPLRFIITCLASFSLFATSYAQVEDLDAITQAEKEARQEAAALEKKREAVTGEIENLQNSLTRLARETKIFEQDAAKLAEKKSKLQTNISRIETDILSNESDLIKLLSALQRLEINPPPALAIRPDDAIASAQAGQLMASLSAQLDQQTKRLNAQLTALSQERAIAEQTTQQIIANQRQLKIRRDRTLALVSDKKTLQQSIETERQEKQAMIERLASEAATLRELLERLQAEAVKIQPRIKPGKGRPSSIAPVLPDGVGPFSGSKGRLTLPVIGELARRYGGDEKGLTFATQSQGQVLAPYSGRVEFAGPFKNYDEVIILSVGEGYFILLTGLGQIYVETGETLRQGDPIGAMPFDSSGATELYLELRKDGRTINPSPWLAL